MGANFPSILHKKIYFFLFYTSNFTKHSHWSIYSTHLFNKIFILLPFFYYFLHCLSLPLIPNHHHHYYLIGEPFKIKPTQDQKPIQAETYSIRNPNHHLPTHSTSRHTIVLGCETGPFWDAKTLWQGGMRRRYGKVFEGLRFENQNRI